MFLVVFVAEHLVPLRGRVEAPASHIVRNLTTAGISLAFMTFLQTPLLTPVSAWVTRENIGLLGMVALPDAVEIILAILLLDYTLWIWHFLMHRVPFLWRFHLVHHVDRDLDSTTSIRFHFGELVLSIVYRAAQITLIGASVYSLWLWQTILFVSILFHHSNLRLPVNFERRLVRLIVTPRMHGIHHADRRERTDSNWSSILSIWDVLHGTFRYDVPDEEITIGVPAWQNASDVTIARILVLPFRKQRDDWTFLSTPESSPQRDVARRT